MAGRKRSHSLAQDRNEAVSTPSPFTPMFESFRNELDEHHDRRERIIKASRDITALSKKMIFSLQRARALQTSLPSSITKENDPRHTQIHNLFTSIAADVQGVNAWRYQRNISSGIQEYIEALTFEHYITTQTLLTHTSAQAKFPTGILLTEDDYLLGLFDLTGELMRFAITNMATTGSVPRGDRAAGEGRDILTDLRAIRTLFEGLDTSRLHWSAPLSRELGKKVEVMRSSVEKVEMAAYGMIIRGRERPKGWVPDGGEGGREAVEGY